MCIPNSINAKYLPSGSPAGFLALESSSPEPPGNGRFTPKGMLLGFPLSGSPPVRGLEVTNPPPELPLLAPGAAAVFPVPNLAAIYKYEY